MKHEAETETREGDGKEKEKDATKDGEEDERSKIGCRQSKVRRNKKDQRQLSNPTNHQAQLDSAAGRYIYIANHNHNHPPHVPGV
jgi:hypothetical protein